MTKADIAICENIADPDTFDWCCPTCSLYNVAPFLFGECARCGYEIDPDQFASAVKERGRALRSSNDTEQEGKA